MQRPVCPRAIALPVNLQRLYANRWLFGLCPPGRNPWHHTPVELGTCTPVFWKSTCIRKGAGIQSFNAHPKLYAIGALAKDGNIAAEQRYELRLEKSLPIINGIGSYIYNERSKVLPKSPIGVAFEYAQTDGAACKTTSKKGYWKLIAIWSKMPSVPWPWPQKLPLCLKARGGWKYSLVLQPLRHLQEKWHRPTEMAHTPYQQHQRFQRFPA